MYKERDTMTTLIIMGVIALAMVALMAQAITKGEKPSDLTTFALIITAIVSNMGGALQTGGKNAGPSVEAQAGSTVNATANNDGAPAADA